MDAPSTYATRLNECKSLTKQEIINVDAWLRSNVSSYGESFETPIHESNSDEVAREILAIRAETNGIQLIPHIRQWRESVNPVRARSQTSNTKQTTQPTPPPTTDNSHLILLKPDRTDATTTPVRATATNMKAPPTPIQHHSDRMPIEPSPDEIKMKGIRHVLKLNDNNVGQTKNAIARHTAILEQDANKIRTVLFEDKADYTQAQLRVQDRMTYFQQMLEWQQ